MRKCHTLRNLKHKLKKEKKRKNTNAYDKWWTQVPCQFCGNGYEVIVIREIQILYVHEKTPSVY